MIFTKKKTVRFSHCDPAGIVFYPRYAELCNEVVEDWFREGLDINFYDFHKKLRLGLPAVRFETEFLAPSTYSDTLEFRLQVKEIGNSSLTLGVAAWCDERERIRIRLKTVMMSMETMRAVPIDEGWRRKLSAYMDD